MQPAPSSEGIEPRCERPEAQRSTNLEIAVVPVWSSGSQFPGLDRVADTLSACSYCGVLAQKSCKRLRANRVGVDDRSPFRKTSTEPALATPPNLLFGMTDVNEVSATPLDYDAEFRMTQLGAWVWSASSRIGPEIAVSET